MLKLYVFQIILFYIHQVYSEDLDYVNDYISLESNQQAELNEVLSGISNEYLDKVDYEEMDKNSSEIYYKKKYTVASSIPTATEIKTPSEKDEDATTVVYKFEKTCESSEEDECRSTLVNYPFSVSILKKGAHYASGALVNNETVLTAAGGFYYVRESIKLYRVRLGSVDYKAGGVLLPVKSIYIHPAFVMGNPAFDLAVVKLAEPVVLTDFIKPIQLSKVRQKVISAKFMTTYWPRLIVKGMLLPMSAKERLKHRSMRVSNQKLIPWKSCYTIMKTKGAELDQASLCLKPLATHHSRCMPDAGAPVVAKDGLWGITSGWTSEHCRLQPSPTIFTRVAMKAVRHWLDQFL